MSGPLASVERVYAIGDAHGQSAMLRAVHAEIEADLAARPVAGHAVVHIGDYTDRGPDSPGVIDFLIAGERRGAPWINLLGNHDRMFRLFLELGESRDPRLRAGFYWLHDRLGGLETLRAYGVEAPGPVSEAEGEELRDAARAAVPAAHLAFLNGLATHWRWGAWFFAHAGVKPGVRLEDQAEDDLIWIRDEFLDSRADHGAVVVHGHTPVERVAHRGNRIAIDTGAAYGGPLSCVVLEGTSARILGGEPLG